MSSVRRLSLVSDEVHASMPLRQAGALRVAIATQDMKNLNAHFGSAKRFAVYDVTREEWQLVEAVAFDDVSDESGTHRSEGDDRIAPKVAALKGCHLLFCLAIGGPSAAKVISAKIHPIKVPQPQTIQEVLLRTQTMLRKAPPPWLRKVLAEAGVAEKKPCFEDEDFK
ncbi:MULTISPECIES: nitrogen fixation protein NifX [Mesorhizobium]|uniref:Nitrogen fixation protein NifX n=2 Tax=Mesorhizobium TaxID=68287 RepID=A0ABU5ADW3_9HYPH|nr:MULTISPECIES: nitrogen fixation protein NifX [unclassified Mesorhizobium]MDX8469990.1 nitrogen fixation protein NifX [Mesorhizobium sp. VK23B]MDX8476305.1 nitrogen fixation protein NifX [Mesorhizobium sp. VK23A]MDX8515746.1 nitrogen fixation protein NifX [Mesorhizobium sp. VK23E]MDX8535460.1 nitrogen fixation protein NifX [Mesorhizobium sp. VK25D]MDX8548184.1 nitrogen fixation protein NifX [Mesorhizobium sp. VK25A]